MAKQKLDLTNENQSIFKVILWLAWPLFLEQVLSTLVSFVDTAIVGKVLGAAKLAAVGRNHADAANCGATSKAAPRGLSWRCERNG